MIEGKVEHAISYLHSWLFALWCSLPNYQNTNQAMSWPCDWLAELDNAACRILMCPPWHDRASANHQRGGGLSRARHKSPPAISPIILCAGFPLHHQPDAEQRPCHKSSSNRTQLIYIALANYVNICKKIVTAEWCHIVQCGGDLEYCYAIVLGIFNK